MQRLNTTLTESLAAAVTQYSTENGFTVAYLVEDIEFGTIASNQQDALFPAASLIKLFVFVAFLRKICTEPSILTSTVRISPQDVVLGSGQIRHLPLPRVMSMHELCRYMIQYSDNTATNILIKCLSLVEINITIESMGACGTILNRHMMSSDPHVRDNFTSCSDIALLYRLLLTSLVPGVDAQWSNWAIEMLKETKSERIGFHLDAGVVTACKSGTGTTVIHDSAILFDSIIVVVMIKCMAATFNRPSSHEFRAALSIFGDIGKIVSDWRTHLK